MNKITTWLIGAVLALPVTAYSHDIVSAGADGLPLPPPAIEPVQGPEYVPLDANSNGRFVLFANYRLPEAAGGYTANSAECTVYRKDRITGDLLTVFQSEAGVREYCRGGLLSADGNLVVVPVAAPPSNPDGEIIEIDGVPVASYGEAVILAVKDIASGTVTEISQPLVTRNASDIARIELGNGGFGLPLAPAPRLHDLSADGNVAITATLDINSGNLGEVFQLVDIDTATIDDDLLAGLSFTAPDVNLRGVAVSRDGSRAALWVALTSPVTDPNQPFLWPAFETEYRLYYKNVPEGTFTELEALGFGPVENPTLGLNVRAPILTADGLSNNANVVTLLQEPPMCVADTTTFPGVMEPCAPDEPLRACEGTECEIRVIRYNVSRDFLQIQTTPPREGSAPGPVLSDVRISSSGLRLLYPRTVTRPFGGDFEIDPFDNRRICIDRDSIDSGSGVPAEVACDITGPTLPFPSTVALSAPTLWFLRNLDTRADLTASIDENGFLSTSAVISDDGLTVVFGSRDPRLRDDELTGVNSLDEALLPAECFWPDNEGGYNIRVVTNDNVRFDTTDTQYIYPFMPVFCPAPSPVITGQVFAEDYIPPPLDDVIVRSSGGSFGLLLVPLAALAWLRRRR